MILQALTAYCEELRKQGRLASPGWDSGYKVSYELRLNDAGELLQAVDLRTVKQAGKKQVAVPREISVPAREKRTVGIAANFLSDNSTYLLGADAKGKPERARQCFEACAALHHRLLAGVDSPAAKAILAFFDSWRPEGAAEHPQISPNWKELTGAANLIFGYEAPDGRHYLAVDDAAIRSAWDAHQEAAADAGGCIQCLVTGRHAPLARLHPSVKGVMGAQSSGAALVSFNAPAFCSYNHDQGENAPVSEYAASAYTAALNWLAADRDHCRRIGDTTVVCWAENADPLYQDAMNMFLFGEQEDSGLSDADVSHALKALAEGRDVSFLDGRLAAGQHFYVLGLAPNAARLSVRFFLRDTFGAFAENLRRHAEALEIVRPDDDRRISLPVWALAKETVNPKERNPSPAPQLAGDLLRSVLTGQRYPATLLNGVTLRIRAEQQVTRGRAAILKAYYLRNGTDNQPLKEVLTVKLNEETRYTPYILGRLFEVLEEIQEKASPGINTTIRERYFNAACATPAMAFPTLINLTQKHLNKLNGSYEAYYNKQLTELLGRLDETYPAHLTLQEQGAFQIGYYHQQQKRYTKKNEEE